jgi:hypothetical protein
MMMLKVPVQRQIMKSLVFPAVYVQLFRRKNEEKKEKSM